MSNALHLSLKELNTSFLSYCAEVEENLNLAIESFLKTKSDNVQKVLKNEKKIDQLELEIEEECLSIMARFQPLASDLRFIVAILKMNNDLERIGDLAVKIVRKVRPFSEKDTTLIEEGASFLLPEMAQKALDMVKKSIDSFSERDADLAKNVCLIDDEVDHLKQEMKFLVLRKMQDSPENIEQLAGVFTNSKHLERVADLATNIAEDVVYWIEGDIIRHQ
jgi:phosphate transport system protein